jgi:hypothetical protein
VILLMEIEEISQTVGFNSELTQLITQEHFRNVIRGESFKSYVTEF